uniref:hypothetical protein n=1 Tax=Paraburkholderia sp. J41 TaxID=2805433 RepID=UPI002AC36B5C
MSTVIGIPVRDTPMTINDNVQLEVAIREGYFAEISTRRFGARHAITAAVAFLPAHDFTGL